MRSKQLLTYSLIACLTAAMFMGLKAQGTRIPYFDRQAIGILYPADTVKVPNIQQPALTDSLPLLSIKDINEVLKYLSDQDIKPSSFLLFKGAIDQLVQYRIKEFNKPKKP